MRLSRVLASRSNWHYQFGQEIDEHWRKSIEEDSVNFQSRSPLKALMAVTQAFSSSIANPVLVLDDHNHDQRAIV